jgi:NAD(P)-dependent dehydrogenase (short-subunit alcohol dehydrogenase family)
MTRQERLHVLVTGANRGLGLAFCTLLAERGDEVIAVCRRSSPELEALGVTVVPGIELTDDAAVASLADAIGPTGLDGLILNAGINRDAPTLGEINVPALAQMFDVNALGAVRTTLACLPSLNRGAKIQLVGVGASAINVRAPSTGNYGYRMSKAALVSFGHGLARDLREREIAILISMPGPADTDMLRGVAAEGRTPFDPSQAPSAMTVAGQLLARMDELTLDTSPAWQEKPTGGVVTV